MSVAALKKDNAIVERLNGLKRVCHNILILFILAIIDA